MRIRNNEIQKLEYILSNIMSSIEVSIDEVCDLVNTSTSEYIKLESEFNELKHTAISAIDKVNDIEVKLYEALDKKGDKFKSDYNEKIDDLKVELAIQKEREQNLINRRNEIENHLNSLRSVLEKSDKLKNNFDLAISVINGNLKHISDRLEDMQSKELLGIKIIETQENERQRIAREMHDGPAQSLTNLIYKTELCIKLLDKDPDRSRLELQSLKNLIRDTINDTRRIIYNLRPMSLDDLGFIPTLKRYIEKIDNESDYTICLEVKSSDYQLSSIINLSLFRIVQEALNNVSKYSNATQVNIIVTYNKDNIELIIEDNGIGFDINEVSKNNSKSKGLGLSIMKERVVLLGGKIDIKSQLHEGTTFVIKVPVAKVKED